jgi:hypothetical protein
LFFLLFVCLGFFWGLVLVIELRALPLLG